MKNSFEFIFVEYFLPVFGCLWPSWGLERGRLEFPHMLGVRTEVSSIPEVCDNIDELSNISVLGRLCEELGTIVGTAFAVAVLLRLGPFRIV
eukprot:scaffold324330_cov75-Attheya_sp.AAC.1